MQENQVKTSNNLTVSVDWLSFTILDDDFSPENVIDFLGFEREQFRNMPNGANGYKHMLKYEDISILYDGASNMGIHINISGGSIATVLESYKETLVVDTPFGKSYDLWQETALCHLLRSILDIGNITRIDLAIDDIGCQYYSLDEIVNKLSNGKVVSKWRTYRNLNEKIVADYEKVGHTLYFGSVQSEIQLRIYDKRLEQNKGRNIDDENYIDYEWVRWELELRKDRAHEVVKLLANKDKLGEVTIGVLSNYFRIIVLDDVNKSRCSLEPKWARFINNVAKLRITVKKQEKTLDEEIKMFEHQNGRKVAKILLANGGDKDYFGDLGMRYIDRLTPQDKEQLAQIGAY